MTELTKAELRQVYDLVGTEATKAAADAQLFALEQKLALMLAERADADAYGLLVFRMDLPLELAPSLNSYASLKPWARASLRKELDVRVARARTFWPRWPHGGRRRGVVVTRHSSRRIDETSVDVIGGKAPIDRLVVGGVLRGDAAKDLERRAAWEAAKPGEGKLVVSIHELVRAA